MLKIDTILVDGPHFNFYDGISHVCINGGDNKYKSIAAASILAKTYRDKFMLNAHQKFPHYGWDKNMAYATKIHRAAIAEFGPCELHRRSFKLLPDRSNLSLFEDLDD